MSYSEREGRTGVTHELDNPCQNVIAIDGPAAAGKTTVARAVARKLKIPFVDTGVLYRSVTLAALERGISLDNESAIVNLIDTMSFDLGANGEVIVNGMPVGSEIRSPAVDASVSVVAAHPLVRERLLPVQRALASRGAAVFVGRDITTVVIPDAGLRIYLIASPSERAARRHRELKARGIDLSLAQVLQEIEERDLIDSTRAVSPLRIGSDVMILDTDGRSIDEVVEIVAEMARAVMSVETRSDD
jgi:CMP/dCMP kinase